MGGAGSTPHTMAPSHGHGKASKKYVAGAKSSVREFVGEIANLADELVHTVKHKDPDVYSREECKDIVLINKPLFDILKLDEGDVEALYDVFVKM